MSYNKKVAAVRDRLRALGAKVNVRRRRLAHREKTYLRVVANNGGGYELVMSTIRKHFPDAYMTSGSLTSMIDITIALEK